MPSTGSTQASSWPLPGPGRKTKPAAGAGFRQMPGLRPSPDRRGPNRIRQRLAPAQSNCATPLPIEAAIAPACHLQPAEPADHSPRLPLSSSALSLGFQPHGEPSSKPRRFRIRTWRSQGAWSAVDKRAAPGNLARWKPCLERPAATGLTPVVCSLRCMERVTVWSGS